MQSHLISVYRFSPTPSSWFTGWSLFPLVVMWASLALQPRWVTVRAFRILGIKKSRQSSQGEGGQHAMFSPWFTGSCWIPQQPTPSCYSFFPLFNSVTVLSMVIRYSPITCPMIVRPLLLSSVAPPFCLTLVLSPIAIFIILHKTQHIKTH